MNTKTILAGSLILLSVGTGAFAQTTPTPIDVDAINKRNAEIINSDYQNHKIESRSHFVKGLRNFTEYLKNGVSLPDSIIPKRRKLNHLENIQKELIRCVDKILDKNLGGYDSPTIAQNLLIAGMDNNGLLIDESAIKKATSDCYAQTKLLYAFPDRTIDENKLKIAIAALPVTNAAQNKTVSLIQKLVNTDAQLCQYTRAEIRAGILFYFGAGAGGLKCLMNNGRVHQYIGPKITFGAGGGASFSVTTTEHQAIELGPISLSGGLDDENFYTKFVTVIGAINFDPDNGIEGEADKGINLGVAVESFMMINGELSFRILNGKRHWDQLIDILK